MINFENLYDALSRGPGHPRLHLSQMQIAIFCRTQKTQLYSEISRSSHDWSSALTSVE